MTSLRLKDMRRKMVRRGVTNVVEERRRLDLEASLIIQKAERKQRLRQGSQKWRDTRPVRIPGGGPCKNCKGPTQRYEHGKEWRPKPNAMTWQLFWDYCKPCDDNTWPAGSTVKRERNPKPLVPSTPESAPDPDHTVIWDEEGERPIEQTVARVVADEPMGPKLNARQKRRIKRARRRERDRERNKAMQQEGRTTGEENVIPPDDGTVPWDE